MKQLFREDRGHSTVKEEFSPLRYEKSLAFAFAKKVNASEKLIIRCIELNTILNSIVKTIKKSFKVIDN